MTWRRGGDSNPRCRFTPHNRLAICPVQPLQHLSATTYGHPYGPWRPNGDHEERRRRIPWSAFGLATVLRGLASDSTRATPRSNAGPSIYPNLTRRSSDIVREAIHDYRKKKERSGRASAASM